MPLDGITLHEGYNDLGTTTLDINNVKQETNIEKPKPGLGPVVSNSLLFKFVFDPSGNAIPPDYTIEFDLPTLDGSITEITDELIARGGQQTFPFTLAEHPIKTGTLSITDGIEVFTDNGDGTLRGSDGGTGTVNYSTGVGTVTFFVPPMDGEDIKANYLIHVDIVFETLGTATGATTYNFTLDHSNILPTTCVITVGSITLTDNGSGVFTGTGATGTINYTTGKIVITGSAPIVTGSFLASYTYWGAADEDIIDTGALTTDFNFKLVHHPIIIGSLSITDGTENFSDNGDGTLTGSAGGDGTIDYETGTGMLTFHVEPDWGIEITASYSTDDFIIEANTNADGYVQITAPVYPVVAIKATGDTVIDYTVQGTLEDRQDELYLALDGGTAGTLYTLITDIFVKDGDLKIFDGDSTYYSIDPEVAISGDMTAVKISEKGEVSGYDSVAEEWTSIITLTFSSIQHSENLDILSDGFYKLSSGTGTVTTGHLGDAATVFENFKGIVNNPEPYFINVAVSVFEPDASIPVKMPDFANLMPGDMDFKIVEVGADPYSAPDVTPTLDDIESVSGVTFSVEFVDFLTSKNLNTVDEIRKAGPITYINDFPDDLDPDEVSLLQSHVDLYSVNSDASQNQVVINGGYENLNKIANTAKSLFIEDVGEDLPLFKAAQIHEIAVQSQKLISNLLAGVLVDMKMETQTGNNNNVSGSKFANDALKDSTNSCGCSDCKSGISPFAYLLDLLKYGASHVNHFGGLVSHNYQTGDIANFSSCVNAKFWQPFGTLNVSCDTLHQEYCRVRLVTEVLEKWFYYLDSNGSITPLKENALAAERKQYLMLVYKTILTQAGTSLDELRSIVLTNPLEDKIKAAQKLSNRLSITLYDPISSELTVDRMWLTFNGGIDIPHDLTAGNLEAIFGFRNTQRDVLTDTPESLVEEWRALHLRNTWLSEDFPLTAYSREGVDPTDLSTFKDNWQPIIDPDTIGWEDLTLSPSDISAFSKDLYKLRKQNTDDYLEYCLTNSINVSNISADINGRILKVVDKDIVNVTLEDDEITITDDGSNWTAFKVISRKLVQTNTDVLLKKSAPGDLQPDMFNPYSVTPPVMHYKRVLTVPLLAYPTINSGVPFDIDFGTPVFADQIKTGYVKLKRIDGVTTTFYQTTGSSPKITSVTYTTDSKITLTIDTTPTWTGVMYLVYEVEVPLDTTVILDPSKMISSLFGDSITYTLLNPSGLLPGSITYLVWLYPPVSWPPFITALTDYARLKQMNQMILLNQNTEAIIEFLDTNLHTSAEDFIRFMNLFASCEKYLAGMYTAKRPTLDELYELASLLRKCARYSLGETWVEEEIITAVDLNPAMLMLSSQYFWKSLAEPASGRWDQGMFPASVPILDPELVKRDDLLDNPEAQDCRNLYETREGILDSKLAVYIDSLTNVTFNVGAVEEILNEVATGSTGTSYISLLTPYSDLAELDVDLESNNAFAVKEATDVLWNVFKLNAEDFTAIYKIKLLYELLDPSKFPSIAELNSTAKLLVSAFKRNRLYPDFISPAYTGWLTDEADFYGPSDPLKYYNAIKMNFPVGRGIPQLRHEWQSTLESWNRLPSIQPDIVPPENIKNIPSWTYTTWSTRKVALLTAYSDIAYYINAAAPDVGVFFVNFKEQLDLVLGRDNNIPPVPYLSSLFIPWFTEIKDFETNGQDIRPYIARLGFTIAEYRYLERIYYLLLEVVAVTPGDPTPLIDSEYDDIINIFIAVRSRNLSFDQVLEEFNEPVILSQDFFQIYKPAPDVFPLTDLPKYNQWRSPYTARRAWRETLQTRIDREQAVIDRWQNVLQETEDRNMPLLRDAIIRALTPACEDWKETADQLSKTFFIETKDNCCFKHTRVSFAIETLQGYYFALQNGTLVQALGYSSLFAPNIKKEWEWLGSYSTWRSAMFVFLYPENLLYPTLKRRQSPKFIELSGKIRNANKFSPTDACKAGDEFDSYISDVENLEMVCSTSANVIISVGDPGDCCSGPNNTTTYTTFFFGQSKISGKCYMSSKPFSDNTSGAPGFWEEIPVKQGAKLLCCYALGDRYNISWGNLLNLSLWVFYSFVDQGKIKLAYIKKDLSVSGAAWSDETETSEIPSVKDNNGTYVYDVYASDIIACQHSEDWNNPSFIVTYNLFSDDRYYAAQYYKKDNLLSLMVNNDGLAVANNGSDLLSQYSRLIGSAKMLLKNGNSILLYDMIVKVFEMEILVQAGRVGSTTIASQGFPGRKIIGAFQSREEDNKIIVATKGLIANDVIFQKFEIQAAFAGGNNVTLTLVELTMPTINNGDVLNFLRGIYPIHTQTRTPGFFAINIKPSISAVPLGMLINHPLSPDTISSSFPFSLTIENSVSLKVQSADCIKDMNARATDIKTKTYANLYAPSGTNAIKDVIDEAYYFVPMLLALDQQKRGQYDSALSWYRSIYDYTNPLDDKRKIFYELKLEENIVNVVQQAPDWLLDPLNPHLIAKTRKNAYTKYTLMNIIQCMYSYADREFTMDTIETVPIATQLYNMALGLLKVKELAVKVNECKKKALGCVSGAVVIPEDYGNQVGRMINNLSSLGDAEIIDGLVDDISVILNASTPDTYPENFETAFEMIEDARPPVPDPETISAMGVIIGESINEAGRYLFAMSDPASANLFIADSFASAVSDLSKVAIADLNAPESDAQISWLAAPLSDNAQEYNFSFSSDTGRQNLPVQWGFDPTNPQPAPYAANFNYSNALQILLQNPGVPASYYPITAYPFCTADNPLYDMLALKGNVELYKIRNCRNIAGMLRELNVYAAAIDSVTGIPIIGAEGNLVLPGLNNYSPSQYRFKTLIERSKQIAQQAQQMESLFLSALEKEDAENYAQLRARQDLETAGSTIRLQDLRITQAQDEKTTADLQLGKVTFTRDHFDDLIASGYNGYEIASLGLLQSAVFFEGLAAIQFFAAAATPEDIRASTASLLSYVGQSEAAIASTLSTQASFLSQIASYQRRAEEWQFQSQLAKLDIGIANQQIKVSEDNVRIVTQERQIAVLGKDHAQASLDFLKNKFTSAEMYNWMGNVLERSYSYMLSLATGVAKAAESQLYFERQETAGPIILDDYWETPSSGYTSGATDKMIDRRGLTGSARLMVDITKLEQHALDAAKRKLQMTKVVSLAQNFPSEFQGFKETGVFNFGLTNKMFDYDFPGHYLRLINSVKTTVIGLLPVYDQIKATLTAGTTSYTVIGGNTFQKIPVKRLQVDSVALTSANNATGIFDMQPMQNEMLNPFEGMGIESQWEFKMPLFSNRCDFENIADILISVEYTALDSFLYRSQVLEDLDYSLTFNRGFSFKNNFPDQWYELAEAISGPSQFGVEIELKRELFPAGILNLKVNMASNIVLYFVTQDGFTGTINVEDFNLSAADAGNQIGGFLTDGKFTAEGLNQAIGNNSPAVKLRLLFKNTLPNRELFSKEQVKDILLLMPCKAELRNYPL